MPHDPPSLSRARLESVLGLGPGASKASLMRAAMRLLTRLEDRLEGSAAEERAALQREIQGLSESTLHWGAMDATSDAPGTGRWAVMGSSRLLRMGMALLVLGAPLSLKPSQGLKSLSGCEPLSAVTVSSSSGLRILSLQLPLQHAFCLHLQKPLQLRFWSHLEET